jgi:hypothetical protein
MKLHGDPRAPGGKRVKQEHEADLRDAKPYTATDFAHDLPTSVADLEWLTQRDPLSNASASLKQLLQQAPAGVAPMGVQMQGVLMSGNVVEGGLLWLRLANASLEGVSAVKNIGGLPLVGFGNSSSETLTAHIAASVIEGSGSPCDPPVYDAFIRVVGPLKFSLDR